MDTTDIITLKEAINEPGEFWRTLAVTLVREYLSHGLEEVMSFKELEVDHIVKIRLEQRMRDIVSAYDEVSDLL